jgi:two-component SAPR family response regulator
LTHAGYADVAVSWFFCTLDYCITPTMQERAIQTIEESWKAAGREGKVDVTRVECDHVPVYSANEELVKWVEGLVEKGGRE